MQFCRRAAWLVVVGICLMLAGHGTAAAADQLTITVVPDSITPPLDGETNAAVLTTNNTDAPVTVRLTMDANELIESHDFGAARSIPAKGTISWDLPIRRVPGSTAPNSVLITAAYAVVGVAGELTTAVAVPVGVPPGAFDISKAAMTAGGAAIRVDDVHDSQFAVEISNSSQQPITVDSLAWSYPDFLQVSLTDAVTVPFVVPASSSTSLAFTVRGTGALERGSNQIRLVAGLGWDGQEGNLVADQPVDVGAFGESEIGDLVSIPTLLVLPGAVTLALLAVLWALGVRPVARDSKQEFPVTGALQIGVAILLLSALAILGNRLFTGRSLLAGYGSRDILVLVVVFALVAVVVYLGFCGYRLDRRRKKQETADKLRAAEALTPGMPAREVLERLAVRKSDLWVSWALQKTGGGTRIVLLPNDDRPDEPTLVCVPIELRLAATQERPSTRNQQMEQELLLSLRPGRPAAEAIAVLAKLGTEAEPAWRPAKYLKELEPADAGDLIRQQGKAPLVYLA